VMGKEKQKGKKNGQYLRSANTPIIRRGK